MTYQEIPGAYVSQTEKSSWVVHLSQPPAGKYTVNVIGKQSGEYLVELDLYDGYNSLQDHSSSLHGPISTGTIQAGSVVTYIQNYDPKNLASSTLVLQR